MTIKGRETRMSRWTDLTERFWMKVDRRGENECWPWIAGNITKDGYGRFYIGKRRLQAHRVAWVLARGEVPEGKCVCHNCPGGDNPACCNPAHLWLGTHTENIADRDKKGRTARLVGEQRASAKLTEYDVRGIRWGYQQGFRQSVLAEAYGVSRSMVSMIVTRKAWTHVKEDEDGCAI